jgi:RNA polymerase sigma-70 factor (ECF subfamily)
MTGKAVTDLRPLMLSIAYRMIGSYSEAEDVVQDAYLRLHETTDDLRSEKAWLTTVVTRLSIDHLRSARVRREQYTGTWLPEPVFDDPAPELAARAETLSVAFLVVLETLSPVERAVFLLHDVFDYGYDEIATIVERSQANCRQLAVRARRRVEERTPRFDTSREQREALAQRLWAAMQEGKTEPLVELLAADVAFYGDGGGRAAAIPAPLHGREKVLRFLLGLGRYAERHALHVELTEVNGQPGLVARDADGALLSVAAIEISGGAVTAFHSVVNPEKLRHLT